eukprot:1664455-Pleurochrysis_carterae.AAC.1
MPTLKSRNDAKLYPERRKHCMYAIEPLRAGKKRGRQRKENREKAAATALPRLQLGLVYPGRT